MTAPGVTARVLAGMQVGAGRLLAGNGQWSSWLAGRWSLARWVLAGGWPRVLGAPASAAARSTKFDEPKSREKKCVLQTSFHVSSVCQKSGAGSERAFGRVTSPGRRGRGGVCQRLIAPASEAARSTKFDGPKTRETATKL